MCLLQHPENESLSLFTNFLSSFIKEIYLKNTSPNKFIPLFNFLLLNDVVGRGLHKSSLLSVFLVHEYESMINNSEIKFVHTLKLTRFFYLVSYK